MGLLGGFRAKFSKDSVAKRNSKTSKKDTVVCVGYRVFSEFQDLPQYRPISEPPVLIPPSAVKLPRPEPRLNGFTSSKSSLHSPERPVGTMIITNPTARRSLNKCVPNTTLRLSSEINLDINDSHSEEVASKKVLVVEKPTPAARSISYDRSSETEKDTKRNKLLDNDIVTFSDDAKFDKEEGNYTNQEPEKTSTDKAKSNDDDYFSHVSDEENAYTVEEPGKPTIDTAKYYDVFSVFDDDGNHTNLYGNENTSSNKELTDTTNRTDAVTVFADDSNFDEEQPSYIVEDPDTSTKHSELLKVDVSDDYRNQDDNQEPFKKATDTTLTKSRATFNLNTIEHYYESQSDEDNDDWYQEAHSSFQEESQQTMTTMHFSSVQTFKTTSTLGATSSASSIFFASDDEEQPEPKPAPRKFTMNRESEDFVGRSSAEC